MSEWNAGYYGSGLRLNEEEFMSFFKRYLALNPKEPKMAIEYFAPGATCDQEEVFEVIDDGGKHSVVVLYDQIAKQSLRVALNEDSAWSDRRLALRQLQPYTISLTDKQMEATFGQKWEASGRFVYVLPEECYTEELGYTSL